MVSRRMAFLSAYQNARYAAEYAAYVDRVRSREKAVVGAEGKMSEAVARYLFKLMAYKDEYEVARLYSDGTFRRQLAETFDGTGKLTFHLSPPLVAKKDPNTGEPAKMTFGPWMLMAFGVLAKFKGLRGTKLDLFGYSNERRAERALIGEYRARVERAMSALTPDNHATAVAIAEVPEEIRGFGHVKEANLAKARARWAELETTLSERASFAVAAE
jgi:indolepyruvate ferredoxin oxidoreductase